MLRPLLPPIGPLEKITGEQPSSSWWMRLSLPGCCFQGRPVRAVGPGLPEVVISWLWPLNFWLWLRQACHGLHGTLHSHNSDSLCGLWSLRQYLVKRSGHLIPSQQYLSENRPGALMKFQKFLERSHGQ